MRIAAALGLGATAVVLAACVAGDDGPRPRADVAEPAYEAPDGAPAFCTRLASIGELVELPASIGTLAAGADVEARTQVSRTMRELRAVLADVREDGGHDRLSTALDDLVRALGPVVREPLAEPALDAVVSGLTRVGDEAQPTCGFPT